MKPKPSIAPSVNHSGPGLRFRAALPAAVATLVLAAASVTAQQVTSTTPGEIAVRSNFDSLGTPIAQSQSVDNVFDYDELNLASLTPSSDLLLSQGKYLVLYNCRVNDTGGTDRSNILCRLSLEAAGSGTPVDLPYGTSQGFIRDSGNNPLVAVLSGGTIVEATNTDDILRLHTTRTDLNVNTSTELPPGGSAIQFLKLDDGWDYLRLTLSGDSGAPTDPTFTDVLYDVIDEPSAGAMNYTAGTGAVTFNADGHYLVLANTHLRRTIDENSRVGFTQQLTLDGTPIEGSKTTTYIRGTANAPESCLDGVTSVGIIVEAAAGQTLKVELSEEFGSVDSNIIASGTGLAIVQLPSFGNYLSLSDLTGQNINPAASTPMTFATQEGTPGSDFTHTAGTSPVVINTDGSYLFLGAFFCDQDTNARQVPHQQWSVNGGQLFYGQSSQYSRNLDVFNNGNWSGIVANLLTGDEVEMTSGGLSNSTTAMPGDSMGLQGVRIESLFPSNDPILAVNIPLTLVQGTSETITSSLLRTVDADTAPSGLTYTVNALPDPSNGSLLRDGVALAVSGTFTQEDVDLGLITYDATANTGAFEVDLTVSDGANSDNGIFTVSVGLVTVAMDDTGATDEETAITLLAGAAPSVLDNDTGTGLTISAFDSMSVQGAAVNVNPDGTFSYNPTGSTVLQALGATDQVIDTFTYTVTDFANVSTPVTVSITVDGVNDTSVVTGEAVASTNGSGASVNLLANESDTDASDVLTVSNLEDAIFAQGGTVPTDVFNFEFVPLVFTTQFGATVSISADGTFVYDPSTSSIILGLSPGISVTETFAYDVFDGTGTVGSTIVVTSTGASQPTGDYASTDSATVVNLDLLANDSVRNNPASLGTPTAGADFDFVADAPGNTSQTWFDAGTAPITQITMSGGGVESILDPAPVNPPPGLSAVYALSGTGSGGPHEDADNGNGGGGISTQNMSVELLFRPSDQVGREILWEIGGNGNGTSICLIDDLIVFTESDGPGNPDDGVQVVAKLPAGATAGGEFVHLIGQVDLTNDRAVLYLNGEKVGEETALNSGSGLPADITDWSGTDNGGIGLLQGTPAGSDFPPGVYLVTDSLVSFTGEVGILRVYAGTPGLLSTTQIENNLAAVFGATAPAVVADITDVAGAGVPAVGVPIGLPSGATVTLLGDGTFDYDPNGAFDDIGMGLTARDTFTYSLNTSGSSVVTVNVDVAGSNPDPQITIAAVNSSISEGGLTSFVITASAPVSGPVDVNLSFSGLADHIVDFTGPTTVQIADTGTTTNLFTFVLNDGLFEEIENIIVTIASVTGNAVLGATTSAETVVNDVQSEPVFTIASDLASNAEGTPAVFTITANPPSQAERSVTVSYAGTAVNGTDYLGVATATIPGGSPTGALVLNLLDDGRAEGTETIEATLEAADLGTIGVANTDSTEVTDGAGMCLFEANFDGVDPFTTTGGTLLGSDAPEAADLGTAVGSWIGVPTVTLGGDLPGIYAEIDDQKGDGFDEALVLDRPPVGGGDISARLAAPLDFSGANLGAVTMDLGSRRTQGNIDAKSWRIIGLDDAGEKSFELYVDANNNGTYHETLHHVDSGGVRTPVGNIDNFENTASTENESRQSRLVLSLASTGFQVGVDDWPMDGVIDSISGELPYAGLATQVSRILFRLNASPDTTMSSGIIVDAVKVSGTAGNVGPSAALNAVDLADGGTTSLPPAIIGTGTLLNTLQVDDPDAGAGTVTATFQSSGLAALTFSAVAAGSASVGGNGTGSLTISGTLGDVNDTLSAGVTYTTDAVTGGDAMMQFSINDNGNTGPGGGKSLSHDFTFFVNEGPTVSIDQAPGQESSTSRTPIVFQVDFSEGVTGFTGADVDLSASDEAGLLASVTGGPVSWNVEVSGMTITGKVVISVPKGAAQAVSNGAGSEASIAIDDAVTYVPNTSPSATNLVQDLMYSAGPVEINDIVVSDPNDSTVTTVQAANYDFPAVHGDALTLVPDPATDAGFAFEVVFTPTSFDSSGTVRVMEIGGSSNGSGIYLIEGVPHFVSKMNSGPGAIPSGLNDTDWSDGNVSIPLASGPLALDVSHRIALVSSLDALTFSVNGFGQTTVQLTNRGTRSDWSGNDTIRIGDNPDPERGGLGTDLSGVFDDLGSFPMIGSASFARLWHAADASGFSIEAVSAPEEISVTLDFTPGEGDLTVPAGVNYDSGTGSWTVTGNLNEVNAALAAVQFLPNGTSPVVVNVTIEDGDEDGSAPVTGTITLASVSLDADGDLIPDSYETANGLNPNDPADAGSDLDGDGFSALFEYAMGTLAGDGASKPTYLIRRNGPQMEIEYGPITAGVTYNVNASTDGENFVQIDTFTAGADGAGNLVFDTTVFGAVELYQLEVLLPLP